MSDSATPTISTPSAVRLPVASIPAVVLPGAVVTLTLGSEELRSAVTAARRTSDARVSCCTPAAARSPSSPRSPTSVRCRRAIPPPSCASRVGPASERCTSPNGGRPTPTPSRSPIRGRLHASRRSAASCAACSASSPSCAGRAGCPNCCGSRSHPGALADGVATWAEFDDELRAAVLAAVDVGERVQLVLDWARNHVAELQVAESIRNDVTEGVDKQQREYLLAPAVGGDPQGARRGRRRRRRRVPHEAGRAAAAGGRLQHDRQGDRPTRAHQLAVPGARLDPHLARPRLRTAVEHPQRRQPRPRPTCAPCSTPTTTDSTTSRRGSSSSWPSASCAATVALAAATATAPRASATTARSSPSSAHQASARRASASRSPGRWAASSSVSPSAGSATRPRSAATGAPTSARSPGGSPRRWSRPEPPTR